MIFDPARAGASDHKVDLKGGNWKECRRTATSCRCVSEAELAYTDVHATDLDASRVSDFDIDAPGRGHDEGAEARLDLSQFGPLLRQHRAGLSIRQAAADAGVSFSTFSRVEAGSQPDLTSFALLCSWLGISPNQFFAPSPERERDPLEVAISHLVSDPRLDGDKAKSIEGMLRTMYDALATAAPTKSLLAVHLRAATTMRVGVPAKLDGMLRDMRSELEARIASGQL